MLDNLWKQYFEQHGDGCEIADDKKALENRVKPLIRKLADPTSVYRDLPFTHMCQEEQIKLIHHILSVTVSRDDNQRERELVSNMGKTDVDRDYDNFVFMDPQHEAERKYLLESIYPNGYEPFEIAELQQFNRFGIRQWADPAARVIQELLRLNDVVCNEFERETVLLRMIGVQIDSVEQLTAYIDYVHDGILQFLNYRVIQSEILAHDTKVRILVELKAHLTERIAQTSRQLEAHLHTEGTAEQLTADHVSQYFVSNRRHVSKYRESLEIYRSLMDEEEQNPILFCKVPAEYMVKKELLSDEDIRNMKNIFTEGRRDQSFSSRLVTVQKIIEIMRVCGGRDCYGNCPQDVKVYYREIFLSKAKYKGRQTATIVGDFLQSFEAGNRQFEKQSQYMFFREKISRGYLREKNALDLFRLRVECQELLCDALLRLYLFYDYGRGYRAIHRENSYLLNALNRHFTG